MIKNKKKFTSEKDFLKDEFIFEEPSDLSDEEKSLEEDTEFIEFLRNEMVYPIAPQEIIEKAVEGYAKHYRYRILWRKIKIKVGRLKEKLFG